MRFDRRVLMQRRRIGVSYWLGFQIKKTTFISHTSRDALATYITSIQTLFALSRQVCYQVAPQTHDHKKCVRVLIRCRGADHVFYGQASINNHFFEVSYLVQSIDLSCEFWCCPFHWQAVGFVLCSLKLIINTDMDHK